MSDEENAIWNAADVADYLRVSKRTVTERYAAKPWFPKPFQLPSDKGRGRLRWYRKDIEKFVADSAGKT